MSKPKIAIFISGRGSNMQAILSAIDAGTLEAECALVISNKETASGLDIAKKAGVTTAAILPSQYESFQQFEAAQVALLKVHNIQWVCLAGYMKLVGETLLSSYKNKIVNIHPSLLPKYKGLNAQKQAFEAGEEETGCTVHFVDETLDGGPIIMQQAVPIYPTDTLEALTTRLLKEEHQLYPKAIQKVIKGEN